MSKGPWKRCPVTGIPIGSRSVGIPESYLTDAGDFDQSAFPRCNLFDVRSIAVAAGFGARVDHWKDSVECGSYYHLHPIVDDDGNVLSFVTRTNSANHGGRTYRAAAKARQLAGRRIEWDVSSGSIR